MDRNGVPESLSICIIARDEEARLPACLESVAWADEIVLVDSGSTDRTVEIALAAGARVVSNPWPGFAAQRNVALEHARGEWVLELDCDERVTPALADELRAFLAAPPAHTDMVAIPLRHRLFGELLGPSAKYPTYRHRLFRREAYRHDETRTVHEGIDPAGRAHALTGELTHELADSWRELLSDVWRYARLEADQFDPPAARTAVFTGIFLRPPAKFASRVLLDGGWRDGWRGLLKISVDCANDVLVWLNVGRRRGTGAVRHFNAHRRGALGMPRILAVAAGRNASAAAEWLVRAAESGSDVVLVTDAPLPSTSALVRIHHVPRLTLLRTLRAIDAETQLRAVDALLPWTPRERRLLRLLPGTLTQGAVMLTPAADPRTVGAFLVSRR